ncbi:MAG TPA: YceI family protein [Wenzhouxiangella sp.]|nr:YceI family protein [Wenzhouxiangella sp.]
MKIFNRAFAMLLPAALLATASFSTLALADSQEYALDPGHTQVRISWDHLGFSRPGASFDVTEGLLVWNDEDPSQSSVKVTLAAGSAHTQVDELDEMFRDDYFKVSEYPEITFESTAVKQRGDSNRFEIEGELTIVGQTHPVTLEATLNQAGEHPMLQAPAIGFDATATIERSKYGLDAFVPYISDEVEIAITVEAVEPAALAAAAEES